MADKSKLIQRPRWTRRFKLPGSRRLVVTLMVPAKPTQYPPASDAAVTGDQR